MQATVAGFGTEKATRTVSLVLNGREVESKAVEVPQNGRASVEFLTLEAPYGCNKGEVRIDSGRQLAADDTFYFSIDRSDPRNVLFVQEAAGSRGLLYFRTALEAAGESAFDIDAGDDGPDRPISIRPSTPSWCCPTWRRMPGNFENALREYVRGGGAC